MIPNWINVKDKLPNKYVTDEHYVIVTDGSYICTAVRADGGWCANIRDKDITHWITKKEILPEK